MSNNPKNKKPTGCVNLLFERIGVFILVFLLYDVIFSLVRPESFPDWASALGVLIALIASAFELVASGIVSIFKFAKLCCVSMARVVAWVSAKISTAHRVRKHRKSVQIETAEQYANHENNQATTMSEIYSPTDAVYDYGARRIRTTLDSRLTEIDEMDGHGFEVWCADALRNSGFSNVSVTPGSGDQGVDVLAEKDGVKYAVQCKRYSSDLGNTPVQEVYLGKAFYKCHVGVVLTNQHFTTGAKEAAEASGVLLWDREWIKHYLSTQETGEGANAGNASTEYKDEMLPAAVDVILETGQASVSMLQRRLYLGYARAARIVDELEELGIVGPFQGSKPRAILVTKSQWQSMRK